MPVSRSVVLKAVALLTICNLAFLIVLAGLEYVSRPSGGVAPKTIELFMSHAPLAENSDVQRLDVPLTTEPGYVHIDPERYEHAAYKYQFNASPAAGDLGVFLRWTRRVTEVTVNGQVVRSQTPVDFWGTSGGYEPVAFLIPSDILNEGDNLIVFQVNGKDRKILPEFFITPARNTLDAIAWGRLISVYMNFGAVAAMVVLLLICLTARWPQSDRLRMRGLAVLLTAWSFRNLTFLGIDVIIPKFWNLPFNFAITYLFLFSILYFAAAWVGFRGRWMWLIPVTAILFVITNVIVSLLPIPRDDYFYIAFITETSLTFVACIAASLALAIYYSSRTPMQWLEASLFLVAFASVLVDAIDDRWDTHIPFAPDLPLTFYSAPMFGLLLGLGLCATFAAQATSARNLLIQVNEELERRVAEQTQELQASYANTRELEREQARDEERRRILRDMHDGVGSLLLGLSVQIKAGKVGLNEVADGVQKGIDDLRLMVTAMDSVGDDLVQALEAFRQRVRPQLEAAGISLDWQMPENARPVTLSPRDVLNVYRILQEAISNAIRHSGADQVVITLDVPESSKGAFILSISDNGSGFRMEHDPAGRGLDNIRKRARTLNAHLSLESGNPGTRLVLNFLSVKALQQIT